MTSRRRVIEILQEVCPKKPEDLQKRLKLVKLGKGAFRTAYRIPGNMVVKFPINRWGIFHSLKEKRNIVRLSRFKHLRRYCPKLFYWNNAGVIAMEYLTESKHEDGEAKVVADVIRDTLGSKHKDLDLMFDNLGTGTRGQLKIRDFGCIR